MAVSSVHQNGVSSWQACQSNQVSMSLMVGSGGVTFPTLLRVWFNLQFPEGHPPLLSRPTSGPQSSVQRTTSQATPTVAMGVGSLHISHPPAQSLNVAFEHLSSLKCPLVSHPGLLEGFLVEVSPSPRSRQRFIYRPLCIFFSCDGIHPLMQLVP